MSEEHLQESTDETLVLKNQFGCMTAIFQMFESRRVLPGNRKRIDEGELGHRPLMIRKELKVHVTEKTRRVEEAAKELLLGYQKKSKLLRVVIRDLQENDVRDDFDDGTSYSNSDLFELENLAVDRYQKELPVYETTRIDTNRAIARSSLR
ncbi:hypothetical protein MRB53_027851 [Persea americana]|uniref:Uncharacterized protein n=1 Tax=Persea americana TaxID=3435 RepID=A0ACC2KEC7_PERAE|nr:hypothetical protein MRB53_027851 [Persea americana]